MKRFGLWLTVGILSSLPAPVFAQCTVGCEGSKVKEGSAKGTTGSRKGAVTHDRKVAGTKNGTSTAAKKTSTAKDANVAQTGGGKKTVEEAGTGRKKY